MKATQRYTPDTLTRGDLVELVEKLKLRPATEIFKRIGISYYQRRGSSYEVHGLAALQGIPKKCPTGQINDDTWYRPEDLLDLWIRFGSDKELDRITQ